LSQKLRIPLSAHRFRMPLVTRYVLWELIKVFLCALTGMTGLLLLAGIAQEAINHGLGPMPILRMIPYIMPDAMRFSVPATMLLACCSVYGRMSSMNEVVAVKSLGIAPRVMMWPALAIAFVVSLIGVWLNDVAVSWGRIGVREVIVQSVEEIAYGMLRTQRTYSDRRFSINVKSVEGRKLMSPTITFFGDGDDPAVMLSAAEAELKFNPDDSSLSIFLVDGTVEVEGKVSAHLPDRFEQVVPLGDNDKNKDKRESPSYCPLWKIGHEVASTRRGIEEREAAMAAEAAYSLVAGEFSALSEPQWGGRNWLLSQERERLFRFKTEPWRRWANGFSCFFFCIVGVPLAVKLKKGDFLTTFFLCFLPILIVYYPLMALGVDRAKTGELPPYAVWLGNIFCFIAGLWLLRSVDKR
jgi:lipopolysaccharide export system permease protein